MNWKSIVAGTASTAIISSLMLGCTGGSTDAATNKGDQPIKSTTASAVKLLGAGSSFVNPAMSQWAFAYHEKNPNINIDYKPLGSGAGISQYKEGTVDFGASDAPLSDKDQATMPSPTLNIPVIAGATAVVYNIPDVTGDLKLSPDVLADIFLGKIKSWDDARIKADNADLKLPSKPITVCHRSDSSGTTYIFTDYLSNVSETWKTSVGKDKSPKWPTGLGGEHNDGVAGLVKKTAGAIGYVELAFAVQNKIPFASLKNKAGKFIKPSPDSTTAAADGFAEELKKDIRTSIVNSPAPEAYPIAGYTYVLVATKPAKPEQTKAVIDFIKWTMGEGQAMAKDLQYAPLSKSVIDLNQTALGTVQLTK